MPQELPGFYYDAVKNRYFPIKGPIPGTSGNTSAASGQKSVTQPNQASKSKARWGIGIKVATMLQDRESCGNTITSRKGKLNFREQYLKIRASKPMIWKYHGTGRVADGALEQIHVDMDTRHGRIGTEVMLAGGLNGALCLYEVGKVGQHFDYGIKCMPDLVRPNIEKQASCVLSPGHLWGPAASMQMASNISCIKMLKKHNLEAAESASSVQLALITTLGSERSGGSVYLMNLREPFEYGPSIPDIRRRVHEITSLNSTIWSADSCSDGSRAVIGTNLGAALVRMETGTTSWICRSKSDVLSMQMDYSGNIVLCGLRNGAIVMVDTRQRPEELSARLARHRIPYPSYKTAEPLGGSGKKITKQWFELKGNIYPSCTICMPSSVSCLASLKMYDQYFLASSMDGSIKLYDHRLIHRVAVQSYEGNINSHTRIQLGIDPSERFVTSGGEDCYVRLWSIKSGEMLFEDKFMKSVPSVVCWPRGSQDEMGSCEQDDCSGAAWFGSQEGLFYVLYS